jgi:hypothetical protein
MTHSTTSNGHIRHVLDPKQFTFGLIHGPLDNGRQLVELGHLILHSRGDRCYGGPVVTDGPKRAASTRNDEPRGRQL